MGHYNFWNLQSNKRRRTSQGGLSRYQKTRDSDKFRDKTKEYNKDDVTFNLVGKTFLFLTMPKLTARFLELLDVESYTGHSFWRTSGTLLANAIAEILTLKSQ